LIVSIFAFSPNYVFCISWNKSVTVNRVNFLLSTLSLLMRISVVLLVMVFASAIQKAQAQLNLGLKSDQVKTTQVTARLLAYAPDGVPTGPDALEQGKSGAKPLWVGLELTHIEGWHTYWKNSGDSGEPTSLTWTLPEGVTAGDIAWPMPHRINIGDLANYGYEGTVLLPVPLTVTANFKPNSLSNTLPVRLAASWLVCKLQCIPQQGEFELQVPLNSSTALSASAFQAAFAAQPKDLAQGAQASVHNQRLELRVSGLPKDLHGSKLTVFPETPNIFVHATTLVSEGTALDEHSWSQTWQDSIWVANLPLSSQRIDAPNTLPLVLELASSNNATTKVGWRVQAQVNGAWPQVASRPAAPGVATLPTLSSGAQTTGLSQSNANSPSTDSGRLPASSGATPWGTFVLALLGALVGGMLLNLMPCVFPVLAIKTLDFASHAQDVKLHRASGLAYSLGVVVSFLLLGALMLVLRAAGEKLGWGFQLQSPGVIAALATLFTVIGLNLAGVFQFGNFLPQSVLTSSVKHPIVNSLLSGVLAVAIASPCTAPFMGASLGLAIGLPSVEAMLLFAALGLGMALPYLAISWLPGAARMLPRPGVWMDIFRRLMAFPMFGTVTWLIWVLGQQNGIDGAASLLVLLIALALFLWALNLVGRARIVVTVISIACLVFLGFSVGPYVFAGQEQDGLLQSGAPVSTNPQAPWQSWSPQRMQAVLDGGHPVFVDFTAAWCVTCQVNKKTTLSRTDVMTMFSSAGVQTLRADWTKRDPIIAEQLQRLGRSGVPVYLLQAPNKPPIILSELLSVNDIKTALAKL
jgi:thiol:disulfide interchange protein DsbD